jgi:hypothetical protein
MTNKDYDNDLPDCECDNNKCASTQALLKLDPEPQASYLVQEAPILLTVGNICCAVPRVLLSKSPIRLRGSFLPLIQASTDECGKAIDADYSFTLTFQLAYDSCENNFRIEPNLVYAQGKSDRISFSLQSGTSSISGKNGTIGYMGGEVVIRGKFSNTIGYDTVREFLLHADGCFTFYIEQIELGTLPLCNNSINSCKCKGSKKKCRCKSDASRCSRIETALYFSVDKKEQSHDHNCGCSHNQEQNGDDDDEHEKAQVVKTDILVTPLQDCQN